MFCWRTSAIAGLLAPTVYIESDASGYGGGLIFRGAFEASFKFCFCGAERAGSAGAADTDYEINLLEAAAFIGGLAAAAPHMVGAVVDVQLDNTASISWCRRMRSSKQMAGLLLRWLASIMFKFNLSLSYRHLEGVKNVDADCLSRWMTLAARRTYGARHSDPDSPHHTSAILPLPATQRALIWKAMAGPCTATAFDSAVARSWVTSAQN